MIFNSMIYLLIGCITNIQSPQNEKCILDVSKNGDMVRINSELFYAAYPMYILPKGCPPQTVVVVYGNNASLGKGMLPMRKDESFLELE